MLPCCVVIQGGSAASTIIAFMFFGMVLPSLLTSSLLVSVHSDFAFDLIA